MFAEERPLVSTKKGFTGHFLDFAGVVEPPKILDEPGSECVLSHLRNNAVTKSVEVALSNFVAGRDNSASFSAPTHTPARRSPGSRRGGPRRQLAIRVEPRETPFPSGRLFKEQIPSNRPVPGPHYTTRKPWCA